jgi:DNA-binding CsgD family transcriptional regulator
MTRQVRRPVLRGFGGSQARCAATRPDPHLNPAALMATSTGGGSLLRKSRSARLFTSMRRRRRPWASRPPRPPVRVRKLGRQLGDHVRHPIAILDSFEYRAQGCVVDMTDRNQRERPRAARSGRRDEHPSRNVPPPEDRGGPGAPSQPPGTARSRWRGSGCLTARRLQVLQGIVDGLTNKEIAWRLGVSEPDVKFHVSALLFIFGVETRTVLALRAVQDGTANLPYSPSRSAGDAI